MNAPPPVWNVHSSEWTKENRDSIERVFVALRRECLQLEALDETFKIRFSIEDVGKFLEKQYSHRDPAD